MTVQIASSCLPTKHQSPRHGLQGLPALLCPLGSCGSERPFLVLEQIEIERWEAGRQIRTEGAAPRDGTGSGTAGKTVGFGEDTSTFVPELSFISILMEPKGIDVRRTWVHSDRHLEVTWFHFHVRGGDGVRAQVSTYLLGKAATPPLAG